MGFSSELSIEELNRNEAVEAIEILEAALESRVGSDNESVLVRAEYLERAIKLIKKFRAKHQPEISRHK